MASPRGAAGFNESDPSQHDPLSTAPIDQLVVLVGAEDVGRVLAAQELQPFDVGVRRDDDFAIHPENACPGAR